MRQLNPVEYKFATSPVMTDGGDLLKLTLQYLCLLEVIHIDQRWVPIHPREQRKRQRFFFSQGKQFEAYVTDKEGEQFILKLFARRPEFRFYVLRQYVKYHFGKKNIDPFKSDFVLNDMRKAGLTFMKYFPNKKARKAARELAARLSYIDLSIDRLLEFEKEKLNELLEQLGANILLLERDTIEKISHVSEEIQQINNLHFFSILERSFSDMDVFFYGDFGGFDSMDTVDVDGFGGFGGGDFGGGGAGADW